MEEYPEGSGKYRISLRNKSLWEHHIPGLEGERGVHSDHSFIVWCEFAGMFLGKTLFDGFLCPAHLCPFMYQQLLQQDITLTDFKKTAPALVKGWEKVLGCDHEAAVMNCSPEEYMSYMCLTMSTSDEQDASGMSEVELYPGGSAVEVTTTNVEEYVGRMLYHQVRGRTERGTIAFCNGFWEVTQRSHTVFSPHELEDLMCGTTSVDVEDWKRNVSYGRGYSAKDKVIKWFWEIVEAMDGGQRSELVYFVTGTRALPIEGFRGLESSPGQKQPFTIDVGKETAPRGHTCTNTLDLPRFKSKRELAHMIEVCVTYGNAGRFQDD